MHLAGGAFCGGGATLHLAGGWYCQRDLVVMARPPPNAMSFVDCMYLLYMYLLYMVEDYVRTLTKTPHNSPDSVLYQDPRL